MIKLPIKISINPIFWLIVLGAVITGQYIEILTLFAVVLIHELGHVFAAKSYGWSIQEMQILPFGGVANMKQNSDSILEEFIVAIAGPLQNLMMIIVGIGFQRINLWSIEWTTFFIQANTILLVLNIIPITPLDGNKILRSILYMFFPYRIVLKYSIFISIVLTMFFLIWASGFLLESKMNINGIVIGIFFAITIFKDIKELPYVFWQFLLCKAGTKSKRNVSAVQIIIPNDLLIISALRLLRKGKPHIFYVLNSNGEIIHVFSQEKILNCIYTKQDLYKPISSLLGCYTPIDKC